MRPAKKKKDVLIVRKSCLTGKVVWVYWGPSKTAERTAYSRACKMELKRVHYWKQKVESLQNYILNLMNDFLAEISITDSLSPDQVAAARKLKSLSREDIACDMEFYNHVREEQRRREEKKKVIREMNERKKNEGKC